MIRTPVRDTVFRLALLLGIVLTAVPTSSLAASNMLSRIELEERTGGPTIRVRLNVPQRVVTHAPVSRGRLLEIRLASPAPDGAMKGAGTRRETLSWTADSSMPLVEVVYEPNPLGGGSLLVRFSKEVEYTVAGGADFRSVEITLPARAVAGAAAALSPDATARLMKEASEAMLDGNYPEAIRIYTRILESPESEHSPAAQELLGLAYERTGDRTRAKTTYDEYLRRYPDGEGAERVGQRSATLLAASAAVPPELREPKASADGVEWNVTGAVSQFYRMDSSVIGGERAILDQSAMFNDVVVTGQRRTSISDIRAHFAGSYVQDFQDASESELDVDELYVDGRDRDRRFIAVAGRQTRTNGGVLGRLDGVFAGYRVLDWLQVNGVGGLASDYSTKDSPDTDRPLYGLNFDVGPFFERLTANVYAIQQDVAGLVDRRAVGGELRYFDRNLSTFGLLDYDIYFNELNTALALGTWTFQQGATVTVNYDQRKTPSLTTSNALQSQTADSIDELKDTYTDSELKDLARDRTSTSRSAGLGGTLPISESWQLTSDLTWLRMTGTDASGGVAATPGTGDELFWTGQAIGSSLFTAGDIEVISLRYSDTSEWESIGTGLNTRFPIAAAWRISPRFLFDYRMLDNDDGEQFVVRPSTRLEWTWRQMLELELEAGGEWMSEDDDVDSQHPWGYFVSVGYRWNF